MMNHMMYLIWMKMCVCVCVCDRNCESKIEMCAILKFQSISNNKIVELLDMYENAHFNAVVLLIRHISYHNQHAQC